MKGLCRSTIQAGEPSLLGRQSISPGGASLTDRFRVGQFPLAGSTVCQDSPGLESIEHKAGCQDGVCSIEVSFARQLQLARSPKSQSTHPCA